MHRSTSQSPAGKIRLLAGVLVLAAVAFFAGSGIGIVGGGFGPVEQTEASWQRAHHQQASLTAGSVHIVPTVSCVSSGGLLSGSVPIKWTAPTGGLTPTGYIIAWAGTAGTGQAATGSTALTGSIPGSGLSVLGQSAVTVYATVGNWYSPVPVQSVRVTTISALGLIVGWDCVQNT